MRRDRAKGSRAVRAWLFVALSACAVPSCQHYETGDTPEQAQARTDDDASVAVPAPDGYPHT